jgi:K+-sensing histidine kinase KdpD/DNA-binding winged helix-turn-helix (wHTH) protein
MWIVARQVRWRLDAKGARAQTAPMSSRAIFSPRRRVVAPTFLGYAAAVLMIAAATGVGLLIAPHWGQAPVALLFLPAVLAAAVWCGLWPSLLAAVGSALAYNYFFTAPYRTFLIHNPPDVVTVAMLFLVAVVTSHLAGSLRKQAQLAEAHATRNATIAGLARRLLSCTSEEDITALTVQEFSRVFGCNAVLLTGPDSPHLVASAPLKVDLAPSDFAAAAMTLTSGKPAGRGVKRVNVAEWQFHPVSSQEAVIAAIGLAHDDGTLPVEQAHLHLLTSLLDQVALALERARLERDAREFVAVREHDRLRASLLASIGQDIKPRLATIMAAARAMKRAGTPDKTQASTVASEAAKLDRSVDNLVELAPGCEQEPLIVGQLEIDLHSRAVRRGGTLVHLTPKEYALLAELAKQRGRVLTHQQLLRAVWGPAQQDQIDYLRVAIRSLRQKLETSPSHPLLILNEPAVGYRLATS